MRRDGVGNSAPFFAGRACGNSETREQAMAAHMLSMVFALIIGFAGGYGTREWISRRRRAAAREEYFRAREERRSQRYLDELSNASLQPDP
jgi:hypothetical protein